jgi:hypothetical protein
MGGLYTATNPANLPEGSSPRNFDVDYFAAGSVFTRAGLHSVYTYTATLIINALTLYSGIGTFTYTGKTPSVNEDFTLSGFSGQLSFLNGQGIVVISVNPLTNMFNAEVSGGVTFGTFTGLAGIANSLVGNFLGPNTPSVAVSVATTGGNAWANPDNILGNTGFASVQSGSGSSVEQTPTVAGEITPPSGYAQWSNPQNVIATGSSYANVVLGAGQPCAEVLAYRTSFNVPSDATVTGIQISFQAYCSVFGVGSVNVQLNNANTNAPVGTAINVPVSSAPATYTKGSSSYQWGTTLQPSTVNGNAFGVTVSGAVTSGTATIFLNSIQATVFYSLAGSTQQLQTTVYSFSVPATAGISGFGVSFQAYTSEESQLSFQLLKDGLPVGAPEVQPLTTTLSQYFLGAPSDLWGSTWEYSDVNNTQFGVQISASGTGTAFVNDLDILTYIIPAQVNFNYVKSFVQSNGDITTLALDASGLMWQENVTDNPGVITVALSGILPGSYAKSATEDDQEYIMFSNLSIGTERPRVASINQVSGQLQFLPLSQVGPGAPPSFAASVGNGKDVLTVTAYSVSGGVVTFTFTAIAGFTPVVGSLYVIAGTGNVELDGFTFTVLGTPPPTTTTFSAAANGATGSASGLSATATPAYSYSTASITQPVPPPSGFDGQILLWSAGPTSTSPGSTVTFYYGGPNENENANILDAFSAGEPCIVYITGVPSGAPGNGTWLITGHGIGIPPSETGNVPYFTINYTTSNYQRYGGPGGTGPNGPGNDGTFQITLATLTTHSPIPDLAPGETIQITGATPAGWNGSWTIQTSLNSGVLNINTSAMSAAGVATYGFTVQSGVAPTNGEIVTTSELTNAAILNTTGVVSNATGSTFQISGFPAGSAIPQAAEDGQATTFGTQFTFDPGTNDVGTTTPSPIFGNDTGTGLVVVVGSSVVPIGSGTRQGVVFFITESGYETPVSTPTTFTTSEDANFIFASNIPIGPPDTIGRGIAFTEAGQNGVPGANFYVIPNDVVITVGNSTTTYSSTIINDNISTSAKFTFTDAVLLNSEEIDIQGNNLFNLIELGSSAWNVAYASRMFYGLQLNKVQNFINLSFDGGYLLGVNQPLGWTPANPVDQTLITSPVTGQALHIVNTYGVTTPVVGLMYQSAYQDYYNVPIINTNTTYSVRVAASIPSGITNGTLVIDLTDYNKSIGFGQTYGSFSVPFSEMTTDFQVFSGTLLIKPFTAGVSPLLQLRFYVQNMGAGADLLLDRLEPFPTAQPYITAQVYGSYVNNLEAIDASGSGGIIDTTSENPQAVWGGFVLRDELYLLKTNSWYATQDNPNSEPGGWSLREISNRVGACGILAYDTGEEWAVTACREGIFGFNGGQPTPIARELWNLWEQINWAAGHTIWLRNDVVNKRILCGVPLPTGTNPVTGVPTTTTQWLPNSPYNPSPITPNVILMLNYQAFSTFDELIGGEPVHSTMFGTLAAPDMRRKWTIWQIPSPYADFITQQDGLSAPLYICNGINSSKIYDLLDDQLSDDGAAIHSLYCTYGHVNATKAATVPIFGQHRKRYTVLGLTLEGQGNATVTLYPDYLTAKYPWTIPGGINLTTPSQQDAFRPLNVVGNRIFVQVETNAVNQWFDLEKMILTGKADPWSPINPLGGLSRGIIAGAP